MVTFLFSLAILLFVNVLLFTFSVNKPEKNKVKKLVIEKNEKIIEHTQQFIPDVETTATNQEGASTKQSEPALVSE